MQPIDEITKSVFVQSFAYLFCIGQFKRPGNLSVSGLKGGTGYRYPVSPPTKAINYLGLVPVAITCDLAPIGVTIIGHLGTVKLEAGIHPLTSKSLSRVSSSPW